MSIRIIKKDERRVGKKRDVNVLPSPNLGAYNEKLAIRCWKMFKSWSDSLSD